MDKADFLATHRLFRALPPPQRARLAAFAKRQPMQAGQTLFSRGDVGDSMLAVIEGEVRVTLTNTDGRIRTLAIFRPGDIFGEIALLDGKPRTADATAMTDGLLLRFERRDVLPLLRGMPELTEALLQMLCERLRRTSHQVEEQSFLDLEAQLARVTLRLAQAGPSISITQGQLAELVGVARESVNKTLRKWNEAGLIMTRKGGMTLKDRAALEAIATGEKQD
jgi:CRP-like cAMP-binding protein